MPISQVETCRIGGNPGWEAYCGGPCPDYNFRYDMRPENPAATYERGQTFRFHYTKNNHEGGFMRLSIVPLDEKDRKDVHDLMAFYYGCWSSNRYNCDDKQYHTHCGFDRDNLSYFVDVRIPPIYPDGVYVLGFTWYGGGEGFGSFGDYYDCSYIRIRGGPMEDTYQAEFRPGPRFEDGCQASVNELGVCLTEPCPQEFWSDKRIPREFENGNQRMIFREWFEEAQAREGNRVEQTEWPDFGITGFSLYDTGNELEMDVDLNEFVDLTGIQGITITPKYFGDVNYVEWVVNGELQREERHEPFAISGQQPADSPSGYNFYDWHYPVFDKRVFVTAIAHSHGRKTYYSQDFYFRRN